MHKKTKTVLLAGSIILFVIVTPLVIFYCQGYRLDFRQKKIIKTGAFYLKGAPKSIKVFINGESKKKTDFFFGALLLENLLPNEYTVELKKLTYQDWKKKLKIEDGQVTEAKNILLFPSDLKYTLSAQGIKNFWFSPDNKTVILKEERTINERTIWDLQLYDIQTNIKSRLLEQSGLSEQRSPEESDVLDIEWSPDSKRLLVSIQTEGKTNYFFFDLEKTLAKPTALDFLISSHAVFLHPSRPEKLFFSRIQDNNLFSIFELDIEKREQKNILKDVFRFDIFEDTIYWLSSDGFLKRSNFEGKSQAMSIGPVVLPAVLTEKNEYHLYSLNPGIFLLINNNLSLFDKDIKGFKEIFSPVSSFVSSPSLKKICFSNGSEIWLFLLEEDLSQPRKAARAKVFLTRFSENIQDLFWIDDYHLVFRTNSNIKVIETDDRNGVQFWELTHFENPKLHFNPLNKRLYILDKESMFISDPLF